MTLHCVNSWRPPWLQERIEVKRRDLTGSSAEPPDRNIGRLLTHRDIENLVEVSFRGQTRNLLRVGNNLARHLPFLKGYDPVYQQYNAADFVRGRQPPPASRARREPPPRH
jgi:hypothetical protein